MRQFMALIGFVLVIACGTDRGIMEPNENSPSETKIPTQQLDSSMQGQWTFTRYWNKGTTDGPSSWDKVTVKGQMIEFSSGEESKDSGSWLVAGQYGVVGGKGSSDSPYALRMLVKKAIGDDLHPAPIKKGKTIEFGVYLNGEVLKVDFPKASMTLNRATGSQNVQAKESNVVAPKPASAHSCASDEDCINSCTFGAVNKDWYSKTIDPTKECKDGCAAKGSDAKCESRTCVAYLRGERSDHCTGRKVD